MRVLVCALASIGGQLMMSCLSVKPGAGLTGCSEYGPDDGPDDVLPGCGCVRLALRAVDGFNLACSRALNRRLP